MRTLSLFRRQPKVCEARPYHVFGHIAFTLYNHDTGIELSILDDAFKFVDETFPWYDPATPIAGRSWLQLRHCTEVISGTPACAVNTEIILFRHNMTKAQVYAYEKYLTNLAKELAKLRLPNVREVRSYFTVKAESYFQSLS